MTTMSEPRLVSAGRHPAKPDETDYARLYTRVRYVSKFNAIAPDVGFNNKYELMNLAIGTNTRFSRVTLR